MGSKIERCLTFPVDSYKTTKKPARLPEATAVSGVYESIFNKYAELTPFMPQEKVPLSTLVNNIEVIRFEGGKPVLKNRKYKRDYLSLIREKVIGSFSIQKKGLEAHVLETNDIESYERIRDEFSIGGIGQKGKIVNVEFHEKTVARRCSPIKKSRDIDPMQGQLQEEVLAALIGNNLVVRGGSNLPFSPMILLYKANRKIIKTLIVQKNMGLDWHEIIMRTNYATNNLKIINFYKFLKIIQRGLEGINQIHKLTGKPHGDIKLENLAEHGLLDLELLARKDIHVTAGTRSYFSPERVAGKYQASGDIWALGLSALILLLGRIPFNLKSKQAGKEIPYDTVDGIFDRSPDHFDIFSGRNLHMYTLHRFNPLTKVFVEKLDERTQNLFFKWVKGNPYVKKGRYYYETRTELYTGTLENALNRQLSKSKYLAICNGKYLRIGNHKLFIKENNGDNVSFASILFVGTDIDFNKGYISKSDLVTDPLIINRLEGFVSKFIKAHDETHKTNVTPLIDCLASIKRMYELPEDIAGDLQDFFNLTLNPDFTVRTCAKTLLQHPVFIPISKKPNSEKKA